MSTTLSLLGVALFIICTISVAAAVTWAVVRVSPAKKQKASESSS